MTTSYTKTYFTLTAEEQEVLNVLVDLGQGASFCIEADGVVEEDTFVAFAAAVTRMYNIVLPMLKD